MTYSFQQQSILKTNSVGETKFTLWMHEMLFTPGPAMIMPPCCLYKKKEQFVMHRSTNKVWINMPAYYTISKFEKQ